MTDEYKKARDEAAAKASEFLDARVVPGLDNLEFKQGADFGYQYRQKEVDEDVVKCVAGCSFYSYRETRHHKDCPHYPETFTKMYDDLEAKLYLAIEALEFYANDKNYISKHGGHIENKNFKAEIGRDWGRKAKVALAKLKESE